MGKGEGKVRVFALVLAVALLGCNDGGDDEGASVAPTVAPCTVECRPCDGNGPPVHIVTPWCGTKGKVDVPICFTPDGCFYDCGAYPAACVP